ncbi:MAG: hypothetical protein Q7S87_00970 [Agitococcus sp.]|nr:hypothetical protein [Agitococcus sp.]MDO9179099.1 hypothetical protein [Agitococcus sp.]
MIPIDADELIKLMKKMDEDDPIDFTNVPADSDELERLVAKNVTMQIAGLQEAQFSPDHQLILMQVIASRLLLENLVLKLNIEVAQGRNPREALRLLRAKLGTADPTTASPPKSSIILP